MAGNATHTAADQGGAFVQVCWTEHESECLEDALDEASSAIRHSAVICAHVRDIVREAAPREIPVAVASILHMTFLALDALMHRECEVLVDAESRIWRGRREADEKRETAEETAGQKEDAP